MPDDDDTTPNSPSPPRSRTARTLIEWAGVIVLAVVLSILVRTFAFQTYFVPSGSMQPTLDIGDRILVDKLSVDWGTINIGDIVVFKAPKGVAAVCHDNVADLVKRVVGVPGDRLYSSGNRIFVNGHLLHQRWSVYPNMGVKPIAPITLGKNQYFMLGDNHAISCDSRYWGPVPRSSIIGKVFLRFWPLDHWHWY